MPALPGTVPRPQGVAARLAREVAVLSLRCTFEVHPSLGSSAARLEPSALVAAFHSSWP
ncbi:hypothetical protein D3C80_2126250 [compost metagenome]